jgi:hypothetical protein
MDGSSRLATLRLPAPGNGIEQLGPRFLERQHVASLRPRAFRAARGNPVLHFCRSSRESPGLYIFLFTIVSSCAF